jgi:1-deoxy-D-xylulose-5-phosphate reductoisomerase
MTLKLEEIMTDCNLPHKLTILGSTGSIGTNTVDVLERLGGRERFQIKALSGASNIDLLAKQAISLGAELAVTADDKNYGALKSALAGSGVKAASGQSGLMEAAQLDHQWVMGAIAGSDGLRPTIEAAKSGASIALANKECLVAAGDIFMRTVISAGGKVIPVDSEHSAIFQCLETHNKASVERVIITASGGPFRTWSREEMAGVSVETAKAHPNWSMGLKVSIGSASMFNKALEMIEAKHLFDLTPEQIEVSVHAQSIVHSMVAYTDGSIIAQLGAPDMRTAIAYSLTYPSRANIPVERLDFAKLSRLDFEAPDEVRFPSLRLAREVLKRGGGAGACFNAADEAAFNAFVAGRIGFLQMADIVEAVLDQTVNFAAPNCLDDIFALTLEAKRIAEGEIAKQQKAA